MRLLTFFAGVAAGVLLQQSLAAKRATSTGMPYEEPEFDAIAAMDDTDPVRPGTGLDVTRADAPVVAGVGMRGDGLRT